MFLFGSATVMCTLSTLAIDEPAASRISFIVVRALWICTLISPASLRRSGYQPPIPATKSKCPDRMHEEKRALDDAACPGRRITSFLGVHDPPLEAVLDGACAADALAALAPPHTTRAPP